MSTIQNGNDGENNTSPEKDQQPTQSPTYHSNGLQNSWHRPQEEDDNSQYFMSEPSISEEGSEHPVMRGLAILSPQDSLSGTLSASSDPHQHHVVTDLDEAGLTMPPPPPQPQSPGFLTSSPPQAGTPSSPGGTTSLSSRESPFWPRKYHFMAYPPGESDQSGAGSFEGPPYRPKVDASAMGARKPLQSPGNDTETDKSSQKEGDNASEQKHEEGRDTMSSLTDDGPHGTNAFLNLLKLQSLGAVQVAHENGGGDASVNSVIRSAETDTGESDNNMDPDPNRRDKPDEKLSVSLDKGQQNATDDKKAPERQRRKKVSGRSNHRRTRSGDDVAAMIMTGGTEWRGMGVQEFPAPPLFAAYDDDEDDAEEMPSRTAMSSSRRDAIPSKDKKGMTPSELAMKASEGFATGAYAKNQRSTRMGQKQRDSRGQNLAPDMWSLSDSTLSPGISFDRDNSMSSFPSYVERRSSYGGSVSTLELAGPETKKDVRSDSQQKASPDKKDNVDRTNADDSAKKPRKRSASRENSTVSENSSASSRSSSKFSWISGSVHALSSDVRQTNAPPPPYPTFRNSSRDSSRARVFEKKEESSSGSESSYYSSELFSSEEDEPLMVQDNRLQNSNPNVIRDSNFHMTEQRVHRPRQSPFANIGKTTRKFINKQNYAPTTLAEDADRYPTFICPRCKTRQREFFSTSTAPAQDSPAGYLAFYFFIYVVASLYIFGLQEGWNALDCVYFAVITLTTAGLGDFVPTSDGAKVICSIFIYFGVACIGLLLGSYLAGSLDEASQKEAQANRVDSCLNCNRLKTLKAAAKVKRRASVGSGRVDSGDSPASLAAAKRFMSEGPDRGSFEHHQAVYERAEKRHKQQHADAIERPGMYSRRSSETSQSSGQVGVNFDSHRSLGVIDEFSDRPETTFSSPPTPTQFGTPASPVTALGSPVTANILHRQQHTRHASLDIGSSAFFENDPFGQRTRMFSEDMGRHQLSPSIPEGQPAPPPHSFFDDKLEESEAEDETDSSDESISDSSESSILGAQDMKKPVSKIKTAKYVFLTLKQAVVNSMFIIAVGSTGFYLIENMSAVDSFYFTTVLLTTVGYGDLVPVTAPGKLFATVYVLVAGTVLLHNMSTISMIPLELRKRRIERAVLTQFGDQLDDATLRELATGPLVRRLQLSAKNQSGLDECTREMFALAMLVRLGKVTEHDVRMTFAAFRRLDVGNDGILNSQDIIVGMMQKRRQSSVNNLVAMGSQDDEGSSQVSSTGRPWYFFGRQGSMHEVEEESPFHYDTTGQHVVDNPEHEALLHGPMTGMDNRMYSSMQMSHGRLPSYDGNFATMASRNYQSLDVESGYEYQYRHRKMSH